MKLNYRLDQCNEMYKYKYLIPIYIGMKGLISWGIWERDLIGRFLLGVVQTYALWTF